MPTASLRWWPRVSHSPWSQRWEGHLALWARQGMREQVTGSNGHTTSLLPMLARDEAMPPRNAVILQEYVHRASQGVCDCSGTAFLAVPKRQLILAEQQPACGCYYHVIDIVRYSRDHILIRSAFWGRRRAEVRGGSVPRPSPVQPARLAHPPSQSRSWQKLACSEQA